MGDFLGEGDCGKVYDIKGGWSTDPSQDAVAKWLMFKPVGLIELYNTDFIGDRLAWGVDKNSKSPGLWVILKKKNGRYLKNMPSYQQARDAGKQSCITYMQKIRKRIADESKRWLRMKGAPIHGFVFI